jgi:hypothetical protein
MPIRTQSSIVSLAVICLFSGCNTNKDGITPDSGDTGDNDPPGIIQLPMTVNCPSATCSPALSVGNAALYDCFEPDCITYAPGCWPPGTPDQIQTFCAPGQLLGSCIIPGDQYQTDLSADSSNAECVCTMRNILDLGDPVGSSLEQDCCIDPFLQGLSDPPSDSFTELIEALDNCGVTYGLFHEDCDLNEPATWQVCDPTDLFRIAPNAEFVMYIDENLSYISLTTPLGSDTVSVGGGGSARTGPDKFLTATIAADDATIGSQSFTEWLWWMDGPLDIDVAAGTIDVPMDDELPFLGKGLQNSTRMNARVYMGDDAWGTIDNVTHTWTLDFTQDSNGVQVEIHLEGAYEDAP